MAITSKCPVFFYRQARSSRQWKQGSRWAKARGWCPVFCPNTGREAPARQAARRSCSQVPRQGRWQRIVCRFFCSYFCSKARLFPFSSQAFFIKFSGRYFFCIKQYKCFTELRHSQKPAVNWKILYYALYISFNGIYLSRCRSRVVPCFFYFHYFANMRSKVQPCSCGKMSQNFLC